MYVSLASCSVAGRELRSRSIELGSGLAANQVANRDRTSSKSQLHLVDRIARIDS